MKQNTVGASKASGEKQTGARPYLSVVVVSRNDDHGRRLFRRMQVCLDGIVEQMERHRIPAELVFVEWNPPAGRPLLRDSYPWPRNRRYCAIRVIVVPPEALGDYNLTDDYSIRDLTPWNVGIRRASGRFVLSTVTDVLFSDALAAGLARRSLADDAVYRIDRCDVDRRVIERPTLEAQLRFARRHIVDRHTLNPYKFLLKRKLPVLHDKAPGDFLLLSRERWHAIHGFPQHLNCGADTLLLYMVHLAGARQEILRPPQRLYHIDHASLWKKPSYLLLRRLLNRCRVPVQIIDVVARAGGLVASRSRLERRGVQLVSNAAIRSLIEEMVAGRRPAVYNDERWGLGGVPLEETVIGEAPTEPPAAVAESAEELSLFPTS